MHEWRGKLERVMVLDKDFAWNGKTFGSLSLRRSPARVGTVTRFFGLRSAKDQGSKRGVSARAAHSRSVA